MKRGPKVAVDASMLDEQYALQRKLLRRACESFDIGDTFEALNIGVRLRVLLHDTSASKSLLRQLGLKDRLPLLDSSSPDMPEEVITQGGGLCVIEASLGPGSSGSRYVPRFAEVDETRLHPAEAFIDWWSIPILTSNSGGPISRSDIVHWVANEAGGAHVDADHEVTHVELTAGDFAGLQVVTSRDVDRNIIPPTVRQIAFELESSLDAGVHVSDGALILSNPICSLPFAPAPKLGRNDLCPCGSGLKFKRCYLRRQPRRRITWDELRAEMNAAA